MDAMIEMTPEEARNAIEAGRVPSRLRVRGSLYLYSDVARLPKELEAETIQIQRGHLLRRMPGRLRCRDLFICNFPLTELPAGLQVTGSLSLWDCPHLTTLPESLNLQSLTLSRCPKLQQLPAHIQLSDGLTLIDC